MWSLWEESDGQFSVLHKIWQVGSWQMCESTELRIGAEYILFAQNVENNKRNMDSI